MDWNILFWLESIANPLLDQFFATFTRLGDGGAFWIILLVLMAFRKETRKIAIFAGISLALTGFLVNLVVKPMVMRARPFEELGIGILVPQPHGSSFPSGHASSSFATAWFLFLVKDRYRYLWLSVASIIAFSRMYLMVHFPSDILVGILIGMLIAYFTYLIYKRSLPDEELLW